jgi:hypothetical protein
MVIQKIYLINYNNGKKMIFHNNIKFLQNDNYMHSSIITNILLKCLITYFNKLSLNMLIFCVNYN